VGCWCGYLFGARCRLAYGPADATATHSLASVKSRLVLPFWYRLTWVVPDKGPLNWCVCVCACEVAAVNKDGNIRQPTFGLLATYCFLPGLDGIMQCGDPSVRPSVCLSHVHSSKRCIVELSYYKTLLGNSMLEVEPIGRRGHRRNFVCDNGDCHHHFFKVEFAIFQAILSFTIMQF